MRGEPIGSTTLIIGASGGLKIKWINDESGSHVIDTETDNSVFVHVCPPLWNDFPLITPTSTTATSHPSTEPTSQTGTAPKVEKKKKKNRKVGCSCDCDFQAFLPSPFSPSTEVFKIPTTSE